MSPRRLVVALSLACACEDDFARGWLVDRTRVLGVRVEAASDPSRADLLAGELARLSWLVATPGAAPPRLGWTWTVCAAPPGNLPEPRCPGVAAGGGSGVSDGEIVATELVVPRSPPPELLVLAAFCEEGGVPVLDAARFEATCSSGAPPLRASATIRVAPDAAAANRAPAIAADAIAVDGAPLADPEACTPIAAGSRHTIGFSFRPDARERGETLLLSRVVTGGTLERQYDALEPSEPAPKDVGVAFTAPGVEARTSIFFVLRDGRGGAAFARRVFCVRKES